MFNATGGLDMAQVLYAGFDSEVSMSMKNNVFLNSTGSVNATVCVNNINNGTRSPRVNVAGNTGLDPSRRSSNQQAPWWVPLHTSFASSCIEVMGSSGGRRWGRSIAWVIKPVCSGMCVLVDRGAACYQLCHTPRGPALSCIHAPARYCSTARPTSSGCNVAFFTQV